MNNSKALQPNGQIQPDDLSRVIKLQQKVASSVHMMDELMNMLCEETQLLTYSDGAVVEMADGPSMVYKSCTGTLQGNLGLRLDIQKSLSGLSVLSKQVLYCEDSETDIRVDRESSRRVGARSMICVPLIHNNQAIGVLKVISSRPKAFGPRETELLQLCAGMMSAALSQAAANESLRNSEMQAREATRMKSEFLANMSHEIRTPLNGVLGLTTLLLNTSLNGEQKNYLNLLRESAESLLSIISDILDISKIEARKIEIESIAFDLQELVQNLSRLTEFAAEQKGLKFHLEISPLIPQYVIGDPTRLRQILNNLLTNALKFTSNGSVELRIIPLDDKIYFSIKDTGIGIPENSIQQLFRPFAQLDSSTTRKFGGTGLGLSICHQLVQILHGEIGVSSRDGEGSTFWFSLPLPEAKEVSETAGSASRAPTKSLSGRRILIVDDNPTHQLLTQKMIEKLGAGYHTVSNGYEALAALAEQPYDLVLMNGNLPLLNGCETTRMLRRSTHPWKQIPVIATITDVNLEDRQKFLEAGMNDTLTKPILFEPLVAAIEKALQTSK